MQTLRVPKNLLYWLSLTTALPGGLRPVSIGD